MMVTFCLQDLLEILMKLRDEHRYCLFCGCQVSPVHGLVKLLQRYRNYHLLPRGKFELNCLFSNLNCNYNIFDCHAKDSAVYFSMNQWRHYYPTALELMKMTTNLSSLMLWTPIPSSLFEQRILRGNAPPLLWRWMRLLVMEIFFHSCCRLTS